MGKRILVQRKGRGTPNWQSPTHKRRGRVKYIYFPPNFKGTTAIVKDLLHDPGRGAPVAKIQYENGEKGLFLPPEGTFIGQKIEFGPNASIKVGNVLPLRSIPEGTYIFNIENEPGDGGKIIRGSGTYGVLTTKGEKDCNVRLPSGKTKKFNLNCRCTIGVVAAGGRTIKPFVKAGTKYHYAKAKHFRSFRVSGVAMTAASHPYGGGGHKSPHKPTTTSRNAPPGRKIGLIAARRTGNKK
ncbi:MAG: 50S ribosomal protein L2 [Promethearchaeota archaeon]